MKRHGKLLGKRVRVMVKAGVPPSISKETVRRVLRKADQSEMDSFLEERILTKNEIETYRFAPKDFCKRAVQLCTVVLAGNGTFLIKNITQDKKRFITQSKHMIF